MRVCRQAALALFLLSGCGGPVANPCAGFQCGPGLECFVRSGAAVCTVSCSTPGDTDPVCDARSETCTCHANAACPQCKSCLLACAPK